MAAGLTWFFFVRDGVSIDDDIATIEQIMLDQEAAQNARDVDAMVSSLAPDAVVLLNEMPAFIGGQGLREAYASIWPVFVSADLEATETVVADNGEMAWTYGTMVTELDLPEVGRVSQPGKWLTVLEKIDGEWLVTALNVAQVSPQS